MYLLAFFVCCVGSGFSDGLISALMCPTGVGRSGCDLGT